MGDVLCVCGVLVLPFELGTDVSAVFWLLLEGGLATKDAFVRGMVKLNELCMKRRLLLPPSRHGFPS